MLNDGRVTKCLMNIKMGRAGVLAGLAAIAVTGGACATDHKPVRPSRSATSTTTTIQAAQGQEDLRWRSIVCEPATSPPWCERWVTRGPNRDAATAYANMVLTELQAPVQFGTVVGDWPVVLKPAR